VPLPHLLRLCVACVTNHRIVREHRPEAPTRPRTPERPDRGAGIGPTGRWPGGEAALGSAPPRAQRVAKESGALSRTRLPRLRSIADRSFGEPLWGAGVGGRTRGDGADAALDDGAALGRLERHGAGSFQGGP
jgi:hypothetical protein